MSGHDQQTKIGGSGRERVSRRTLLQGSAAGAVLGTIGVNAGPVRAVSPDAVAARTLPVGAQSGGRLVIGMNMEPDTMDQHVGSSRYNEFVNVNIYDRLIEQASDGTYHPGLAERFELADDGLSITLNLRPDVIFHDGTPFNAEAVKINLDRIADPATKSQKAVGLLGPYDGTEVVDDLTAVVRMREPFGPLLDGLSSLYLVMQSPTAMAARGEDYGQNPVGTGPFIFREWVQRDHITLAKNPDYAWMPEIFEQQGPALLDELEFRFIPEDVTRVITLDTGESDLIINLPPFEHERFNNDPNFAVIVSPVLGLPPSLIINTERAPTDDPNVRLAIRHGIDRDAVIENVFYGVFERADSALTPYNRFYNPAAGSEITYDPELTASMLDGAGWTMGDAGVRMKDGTPLSLVYIAFPGGVSIQIAQLIQSQLRDVGVEVEIRELNNPANLAASQAGEHHLRWLNWLFGDASGLSTTFASENIGSGWNFTRWANDDLDALLAAGRSEINDDARAEIYGEVQQIVIDNALIAPLYVGSQVIAMRAAVQGVRMHPLGDTAMFHTAFLG